MAMGGGGFLMEGAASLLDAYVLSLADRPDPRVLLPGHGDG